MSQTGLQSEFDGLGVERLVMCGLQTEFCVDATCRAAFSRGFEVVLAADAHSTTDAIAPWCSTITVPWRIWRTANDEFWSWPAPKIDMN